MSLVGVHHCQPILHMSKIMFHYYSTDKTINQFEISYMINPSLYCDKVFIIQVEKCLSLSFDTRTMKTIKEFLRNNNTCVMAIFMIYDNVGEKQKHCIECSVALFILS